MKKGFVIFFSISVFLLLQITHLKAESLLLVTDNTPGGNYIRGGGTSFEKDMPGVEIELYRMVAEKLGIELSLKRLPWKLCLQKLEHNQVDGIFPASFKEERTKLGFYPMKDGKVDTSRKTRNNAYFLYKLKGSGLAWNGVEFSGITGELGVPAGWAIVEDLKKKQVPVKELVIHENIPDLLLQKRVEGFICLESVFDSYLQRTPEKYKDIVKAEKPIWEKPYYLMFSREYMDKKPNLAENFWNEIRKIKASEEFSFLLNKYVQ